jgi:chemotaxis protein methyltransferase CheR
MAREKKSRHGSESSQADHMEDRDCTAFLQWALPRLGLRWPGFRRVRGRLCKRLRRRLTELGPRELSEYRALLETHPEEWTRLDGLSQISISRFYRDHGVWQMLEHAILPRLAGRARARGETRLRIWSAGCASGEEPYTLALLFAFSKAPYDLRAEILATDANPHRLRRAHRACYRATSLRDVPEGLPSGWWSAVCSSLAFTSPCRRRCRRWCKTDWLMGPAV